MWGTLFMTAALLLSIATGQPTSRPTTKSPSTRSPITKSPTRSPITKSPTTRSPTTAPNTNSPTRSPTPAPTLPYITFGGQSEWSCVTGGLDSSNTPLTQTECYNVATEVWQNVPTLNLPTASTQMAPINLGPVACIAGGATYSSGFTSINDVLCTNGSMNWINSAPLKQVGAAASTVYGVGDVGVISSTLDLAGSSWETLTITHSDNGTSLAGNVQQNFPYHSIFVVPTSSVGSGVIIPFNGSSCVVGMTAQCLTNGAWVSAAGTGRVDSISLALPNGTWCAVGGTGGIGGYVSDISCTGTGNISWKTIPSSAFPTPIGRGANVTINGLPCVVGGATANLISELTYCANISSGGNITNWVPLPSLNTARYYHRSFIITAESTSAPTTSPTSAPTSAAPSSPPTTLTPTLTSSPTSNPTLSPSSSPTSSTTLDPTPAPTTAPTHTAPTFGIVNYAETVSVSQWTTFQCTSPTALTELQWSFSNGVKILESSLALQPFTFSIGDVTFNMTNGATTSSNFHFTVVGSAPVVLVTGGNTQVMSGSSLMLNANSSYDPNIPNSTSRDLDYNWTVNGIGATAGGNNSPFLTVSIVDHPPSTTVSVMVNASSRLTSLWAVVTTELQVVATPPISNITISGPSVVSVTDQLRLLASVTNLDKLSSFGWSVQPALASPSCKLPPRSSLTSNRALVSRGNCLEQGTVYRFTFTVGDDSMNTAQSWIDVTVARPPSGGTCTISSQTGMALTTLFHIECDGWMDYDGSSSLTYALKHMINSTTTSTSSSANTNNYNVQLAALSTRQYQGMFDIVLDNNNGQATTVTRTVVTGLMVVISGIGGDVQVPLPPITLTPLGMCPPNSSDDDVQYLTTVISSNEFDLCSSTVRQSEWDTLWNEVSQIINNLDYIDADNMAFLARSLQVLASAAQSNSVTVSTNFTFTLSNLVEKLLSVGETTEVSTQTTVNALPDGLSCDMLQLSLLSALLLKLRELGDERLPGEAPLVIQTPQKISAISQTFFSDEAGALGSASISIGLPTELLDQGGSVSQVTVVDYGEALQHCRTSSQQPVSSVVDITLLSIGPDGGGGGGGSSKAVSVQGLKEGFTFSTEVTGDISCGKPVCAWWQQGSGGGEDGEWSRDGCFTAGSTPIAPDTVTCTCTHLTEFSLILRPGCVNATYRALYYLALAGYATILLVIVMKVSYRQWKVRKQTSEREREKNKTVYVVLWQHLMLAILCIARIVACAMLATNIQDWNVADRAVVLLIPFMIEFWVFTLVAFQWASIHHFGMQDKTPFVRVRALFILTNILVAASIIATIAVISSASPSFASPSASSLSQGRAEIVVTAAAGVISVVTFFIAISFLGYAIPLYRNLKGSDNVGTRHKVLVGALVLCSLLLLQSFLHLATAVDRRGKEAIVGGDASEVVELIADLFCIATLLALYHQSFHNTSSSTSTSVTQNHNQNHTDSIKTDNKINLDTTLSLELSKRK